MGQNDERLVRIKNYAKVIEKYSGGAIRPYRADSYINMMNKYGTKRDVSEHYKFVPEPDVPDDLLSRNYESNGLFAKIIDTPAEEAVKHGFELDGITDRNTVAFYKEALDELDWEETAMTALKWARLFGGSIAVMLINDGGGLEDPLNWRSIQSIDDIRVYDRSVITPDYQSMYSYDGNNPFVSRGSRLGLPEYYHVNSRYGSFTVHDSRCLVFQNGILPENCSNSIYQLWGMPEYVRINKAIRDAEIAHGSAPKMLDRSVQAIYKMKNLAELLGTDEGEDLVLKRLQVIDMARGLLNSIALDSEGEEYDFRSFSYTGVAEVIDITCNFLSAITTIPQTILFGRSPAGMNATGHSDFENYYNYVERIQKRMLKKNLRYLLSVIFQAGVATREIESVPKIDVKFEPLWSLSEVEKADLDQKKAQVQLTKAQTAQTYIGLEVLDPTEVRESLASEDEFSIDTVIDQEDIENDYVEAMMELEKQANDQQQMVPGQGGMGADVPQMPTEEPSNAEAGSNAPDAAPTATKLPQDMSDAEVEKIGNDEINADEENYGSVGVIVVADGKVLVGIRKHDSGHGLICGPGGHIEQGETPEQAAIRETIEEFGITPIDLIPIGTGKCEPETGLSPNLFLCSNYNGIVETDEDEMTDAVFLSLEEIEQYKPSLFPPFADSIKILTGVLNGDVNYDEDDWITVNGTHVLIDEEGNAKSGGKLVGESFSEATSEKSSGSSSKGNNKKADKLNKVKEEVAKIDLGSPWRISQEEKEAVKKAIRESDMHLVENPQDVDLALSENMSYTENRNVNIALNGFSTLDRDDYIAYCREKGVKPKLHEEPVELDKGWFYTKSGKLQHDGTPVYNGLDKYSCLSDDDINEYAGLDKDHDPDGYKEIQKATEKAVDSWSDDERTAVNQYSKEYSPVNYVAINKYLATGEGSESVKKAAMDMTSALDHEIGSKCVTFRGQSDLVGIVDNPKLEKIVKQIEKGNFSHAADLVKGLEGVTVTNNAVMSTSRVESSTGFGYRPVQMILKTPSNAKAVDITAASAYGGKRDRATLALEKTGLFGSASTESEVAYKPGASYRIEKVMFSRAVDDRKGKFYGKVFLVCSVFGNSETNEDGGPGSGNFGHKGVKGQVGGSAPAESGYKSMISAAAESKKYKEAMERFGDLLKQENELQKKLKSIPTTLPKEKWTDDDRLLVEICGREYAPTNPEWSETHEKISSIRKERQKQIDKANKVLLEKEPAPHLEDFGRPKDASGEYEGFKVGDTGTSTDISKARIVEMTPREYLERCAAMFNDTEGAKTNLSMQVRGLSSENIKKYAEKMKNGEKFDTPWLDERGINGQEGRHRAAAAFEAGIEKIPVVFWGRTDSTDSGCEVENTDANEDIEWITVNGAHIPIDDDGKALAGGELKGKKLNEAVSTRSYGNGKLMSPRHFVDEEDIDKVFGKRPPIRLRRENIDKYYQLRDEYDKSPVKQWSNVLQPVEERSIENYVGPEYNGINGLLRGQMTERMVERWNETSNVPVQDMITHIETAIDKFELREPITVYRTCEEDLFHNLHRQIGSRFRDDGFVSTTVLDEKVANGNVRMEINVPAGKGIGAYIGSTLGNPDEHEFLLQRGTEFIVRSCDFNRKTGEFLIKLDVVGNTRKDYEYANKEEVIQRWEMLGIDYTDEDLDDI